MVEPDPEGVVTAAGCVVELVPDPEEVVTAAGCVVKPVPDPEEAVTAAGCVVELAPDPEEVVMAAGCLVKLVPDPEEEVTAAGCVVELVPDAKSAVLSTSCGWHYTQNFSACSNLKYFNIEQATFMLQSTFFFGGFPFSLVLPIPLSLVLHFSTAHFLLFFDLGVATDGGVATDWITKISY